MYHPNPAAARALDCAATEIARQCHDIAETRLARLLRWVPDFCEAWNKRATLYYLQDRDQECLDSLRHVGGPADFDAEESAALGPMLQRSSALVRELGGCERVYAIAFGEGARHFHLHLIPRHGSDPATESWRVADLYRAVSAAERPAADPDSVLQLVRRARQASAGWQI
jgi:diadenosine tetraphosphate (Ap4A) HIT family hydrolase